MEFQKDVFLHLMILVTGGTGLLGSHLLYELTTKPTDVRAIYRSNNRIELVKKIFQYYDPLNWKEKFNRIAWFSADILDVDTLQEAFEGIDIVYHCAAFVSFRKKDFNRLMKINREGTANVVNLCITNQVTTLCYVSSTAAIGGHNDEIVTERSKWDQSPNTSGYAISKYSAEKEVWRGKEEGLKVVIVNPSVIIGAGSWNESSMTIFRTVHKGLKFYTIGKNAVVDARDVAEIMVKLVDAEIRNERFLVIGHNITFLNLLEKIAASMHRKPPFINTPKWLMGLAWRISWVKARLTGTTQTITKESSRTAFSHRIYSNDKIRKALDFQFRPFEETIDNAIKGRIH